MKENLISIIYKDTRGKITDRDVLNASEGGRYLQGYCSKSGDLKTFRKDRILEVLDSSSDRTSRLQHYISINPKPTEITKRKLNTNGNPEICFTGFKKEDKERLLKVAANAGLIYKVFSYIQIRISLLRGKCWTKENRSSKAPRRCRIN